MTRRDLGARVGTHASFDAAMRADLDAAPELAGLRARDTDDPALALLDAWAVALDVLAFYQERIAAEGYLGTATEDRSVRELATTVGYRPAPGLAASCLLAFTLEDGVGAPAAVALQPGLKVQSLPGPGELPQTFETDVAVEARPGWNALRPRGWTDARPRPTELHLPGVVTDLRRGDPLLFTGATREQTGTGADWALRHVESVSVLPGGVATRIRWRPPLPAILGPDVAVHALRHRAGVFGHNAPDWRAMPDDLRRAYLAGARLAVDKRGKLIGLGDEWPRFTVATADDPSSLDLDTVYPSLTAGGWAVVAAADTTRLHRIDRVATTGRADFTLAATVTRLTLQDADLGEDFADLLRQTVVLAGSERLVLSPAPVTEPVDGRRIELAGQVDVPPPGRAVIATGRRARLVVAPDEYGVRLNPADGSAPVVLSPGEELLVTAAAAPVAADGTRSWPVQRGDGVAGTVIGTPDQVPAVPAHPDDPEISEASATDVPGAADVLVLAAPLRYAYDRGSVRFAGNVVPASHGETRTEVLGSGNAGRALQSFPLSAAPDPRTGRVPLTHLRSTGSGGVVSTLAVVVDGVRWQEVRSLHDSGPRDRSYVVRVGGDGRVAVQTGDGVRGARLPTGDGNVVATYRTGTGLAGAVPAGRITLLLTRPLGVRGVTNPLPAGLAEDPENAEATRNGIPRAALTLDRVVSLVDHAEAARSFAGIAKAQARWAADGRSRLILVTVAGTGGRPVDELTRRALEASLSGNGDPFQQVRVVDHTPVLLDLAAVVICDRGRRAESVRTAALAAVQDAFSFDRREFDQPITAPEVSAVLQAVDGVQGVGALSLTRSSGASPAGGPAGAVPARLETVRADGLTITCQEAAS
jgi:hypothetical protein